MQTHHLIPHPQAPALRVHAIGVHFAPITPDGRAMIRFMVEGSRDLLVPQPDGKGRGDKLWERTCAELFLRRADGTYREFNFSPSGQWLAFRFDSYREWAGDFDPIAWPEIHCDRAEDRLILTAILDPRELAGFTAAGLSMVIEEEGGHKSYWALAHAEGKPDFHDAACFALPLGAREAP